MNIRLARNLLLLFNGILITQATQAQEDPWNIGFERISPCHQ